MYEFEIPLHFSNIQRNNAGMFFAIGSIGAVSVHYQLLLCFVLVTSYLRLRLVSLYLRLFRAVTDTRGERKTPRRQLFLSHKR